MYRFALALTSCFACSMVFSAAPGEEQPAQYDASQGPDSGAEIDAGVEVPVMCGPSLVDVIDLYNIDNDEGQATLLNTAAQDDASYFTDGAPGTIATSAGLPACGRALSLLDTRSYVHIPHEARFEQGPSPSTSCFAPAQTDLWGMIRMNRCSPRTRLGMTRAT